MISFDRYVSILMKTDHVALQTRNKKETDLDHLYIFLHCDIILMRIKRSAHFLLGHPKFILYS